MRNYQTMIRILFTLFVLGWAVIATLPASAADLVVTRYFSGLWDQPKQESQGLMLQIIDQEEDGHKKAVVYWFTYGDNLDSAWYLGVGQVVDDQVVLTLYAADGIGFMQENLPGDASVYEAGTMTLSFRNCNHGIAMYEFIDEEMGSGEFDIKRLAGLYNSRCSGGISDDTPGNAKPIKLEVDLEPAAEGITGKGKAKFWERADRSDFHVSAEDIADGFYDIRVCEGSETKEVVLVEDGLEIIAGEGQTQFRSPDAEGKLLLTFDPRDCMIEILDVDVVLTSGENVLAGKPNGGNGNNGGGMGKTEFSAEFENTGIIPGATGEASWIEKMHSVEFDVEIKGAPAGTYFLYVEEFTEAVGQIEITADGEKGKLRFSDPQKDERELLNFDPRGQLLEITNGTDVILDLFFAE